MRLTTLLLAAAGLAVACPAPLAQNALGSGDALDAPLGRNQIVNPARSTNAFREVNFRNAIVTGNIGRGLSFRGNIGYAATNDFRGELGSDDLFGFARDAASSSAYSGNYSGFAARGVNSINGLRQSLALTQGFQTNTIGGEPIVTRSFATPGAEALTSQSLDTQFTRDAYGNIQGSLRSTSQYLSRQSLTPEELGAAQTADGNALIAVASPLLGSTVLSSRSEMFGPQLNNRTQGNTDQRTPAIPGLPTNSQSESDDEQAEQQTRRPGQTPSSRLETNRITTAGFANPFDNASNELQQTVTRLGAQPLRTERVTEEADPTPAWITALEDHMAILRTELEDDRERFFEQRDPEDDQEGEQADNDDTDDQSEEDTDGGIDRERARDMAAQILRDTEFEINTFVTETRTPSEFFTIHMTKGSDALTKGAYFTAEERFTAALAIQPGDPLASLGRVHAQLGAGLVRSAALNLRNTIKAHPEALAATFGEDQLPPAQRVDELIKALSERSQNGGATEDAALLLAYLGHHTDHPEAQTLGLERMPDTDPLANLLRDVWTNDQTP